MTDRQIIKEKVAKLTVQPFQPKSGIVIHTTDSEATAAAGGSPGEYPAPSGSFTVFLHCVLLCFTVFYCFQPAEQEEMDALVKALPSVESLKGFKMYPQDFEKVGPVVCYATVT